MVTTESSWKILLIESAKSCALCKLLAVPDDVLLFSKLVNGYGTPWLQHMNAALARYKKPPLAALIFRHSWGICSAPTACFSQMPVSGNGPLKTSSVVIRWMSSLRYLLRMKKSSDTLAEPPMRPFCPYMMMFYREMSVR